MSAKKVLKRAFCLVITLIIVLVSISQQNTITSAASGVISNDEFNKDTSGNPIYSQGGGIFKFGNTYYWYGVEYAEAATYYANPTKKISTSTFNAVTCYTSTDLVSWTFAGDIITSNSPGFTQTTWLGRVGVAYNANSKKYVLIGQIWNADGTHGTFFATCNTPNGDYAFNNVQQTIPGMVNGATGDQTVFTDTDGQSYLCASSSNGRANTYVCKLRASDYCAVETSTLIYKNSGREGNCMFKYNGRYYICSSDLHGWNSSKCYYVSSTNLFSGYSAEATMANSDLSFCHNTQTGFFVTVTGSSGSFVIFCGDRWADFAGNGLGYNQWCPVTFNGTTPVFNNVSKWNLDAVAGTWSVATGNNYLSNPDFEADRVVQTTLTGWQCNGSMKNLAGKQYSGNFVLEHYNSAAYTAFTGQTNNVPNGTYTLKAWVKSSGGQSACYLFARNYGGSEIKYNINTSIPGWSQVTVSNAIVVTNGKIEVGLWTNGNAGNWANVDNFTLTKNN